MLILLTNFQTYSLLQILDRPLHGHTLLLREGDLQVRFTQFGVELELTPLLHLHFLTPPHHGHFLESDVAYGCGIAELEEFEEHFIVQRHQPLLLHDHLH